MPTRNDDLFQRLRRAGIRKPVAKALSELTEDAGKKAIAAGHRAVAELRALADEIEKRLPAPALAAAPTPSAPTPTPSQPAPAIVAARSRAPRAGAKAPAAPRASAKAPAAPRASRASAKAPAASRARTTTAPAAATASAPAPRGENKAKILAALKSGPQTASQISQETGIATATVSAALTRLNKAGEVTKATRGYALPN